MLQLRPATVEDAELSARISTAVHPDEPQSAEARRYRWSHPDPDFAAARWIVEREGAPVGFAFTGHRTRWPEDGPRYGWLNIELLEEARTPDVYATVLADVEAHLRDAGATALAQNTLEGDTFTITEAERHGYVRDRLAKAWELDLDANRDRLLADRTRARARMEELGVELRTLASASGEEEMRKIHRLDAATAHDIPTTVPFRELSYEVWRAEMEAPGVHLDRVWTAWLDGEPIALSFLRYPPSARVWTGYTCCAREHRGKGIATAVKLETLGQAIELGVDRVRTDNDEQNAPMLHINERLGYHRIPGFLTYLKR